MSALRTLAALGAVTALATSGVAYAAPKGKAPAARVCNLVTDDKGDATILTAQPTLDIISGDLAADSKNLTVAIRLDGPPGGGNPEAAGGTRYYFEFVAPGSDNPQYLYAAVSVAGTATYRTGEVTTNAASRTFSTDPADAGVIGSIKGNILTISAPLSALSRVKIKPGAKITGLTVETFGVAGVLLLSVDDAAGKPYVVSTPSCLTPGKV